MKFDKLFKKKRIIANVVSIAVVTSSLLNIPIDGQGTLGRKVSAAVNNYGLRNPVLTKEDGSGTTTWDSIYFGHYLQEDTNGDGTVDEKDEKQPIKWRVLSVDGDDAFLMADQGLDCKPYNETDTDVTWETCTLRSWLNGYDSSNNVDEKDYNNDNFINTAFTAAERSAIKYSWVVNNDNPSYGTEGGNSTIDKVYLLSVDEAADATYGFYTKFGNSNVTREMSVTAFAREKNAYNSSSSSTDYEGNGDWWLRSPGYDRCASVIYGSGYGNQYGLRIYGVNITVRPVLHLNLSSSALWSYGGRVSGKDSSMAVTEMPIPTASAGKTSRPVSRPAIVVTGPSVVPCTTSGIVTTPRVTSTPEPTERPDEENQAFLMFTDKDWNWSNLNTKITGGNGQDTVITGNGTYTVSINKSDFSDGSMVENPANGAKVFGVDIQGICNTQKFDVSKMAISDVIVKCDGKEITTDQSKMYEGNIEGKGNYRLEIRNEWGYGYGDFATKDEFDEMNPDFTFEDSLSVTFTITGIKEGKTPEGAFVDKDDRSVVEVGGKRARRVAEENVTPTPEITRVPSTEIPTRMPPTMVPTKMPSTPEPTQKTDAENTSTTTPGVTETFMPTDSPVNSPGTDNTVPIHSNEPSGAQQTPSVSNSASPNLAGVSGSADGKTSNESTVSVKNVKAVTAYKKKSGYRYQKIVKLSWDQAENADGFYIYRRESISGEKRIADISIGDVTDYTDSGVKMGESYTYRVLPYVVQKNGELTAGISSSKVTVKIGTVLKKPMAKIKTSGKRMTLTFSTVEGDTYETQYRWIGAKKWKKQNKIKGKIKKKIIKSLNAKGFSLRVRTCTVINGHKVYSKWSAPMKVK